MKNNSNSTSRQRALGYSASILSGLGLLSSNFIAPPAAITAEEFAIPDAPAAVETTSPAAPTAPSNSPLPRIAPKPAAIPSNPSSAGKNLIPAPKISLPARQKSQPIAQPAAPAALQGKNSLIDTTSYGQQERQNYTPPSQVVLTERSTGCSAVSQNGKLLMGSCGSVALKQPPVPRQTRYAAAPRQLRPASTNSQQPRPATIQAVPTRWQPVRPKVAVQNSYPRQVFHLAAARTQGLSLALEPIPQNERTAGRYPAAPLDQRRTSLIFPLPIAANITSPFGWRVHPIAGSYRMHAGTDIGAPTGTPVLATYGGEVAIANWEGGYGLTVALRHENGTQESRYAHLSEIYVQPGQWVEQGTVIGRVGSTGYSTGPHLHFEWRHLTQEGWVAVDAGLHLEYALENFLRSLQLAQTPAKPQG